MMVITDDQRVGMEFLNDEIFHILPGGQSGEGGSEGNNDEVVYSDPIQQFDFFINGIEQFNGRALPATQENEIANLRAGGRARVAARRRDGSGRMRWLRGTADFKVGVRQPGEPYEFYVEQDLSGGKEWKSFKAEFKLDADKEAFIMFVMPGQGTIDLAGVTVREVK